MKKFSNEEGGILFRLLIFLLIVGGIALWLNRSPEVLTQIKEFFNQTSTKAKQSVQQYDIFDAARKARDVVNEHNRNTEEMQKKVHGRD